MKFITEREVFLAALTATQAAVESKSTILILSNVLIKSKDAQTITLHSTGLDIAITCEASAEIADEGAFTTPSALLTSIIKKLPPRARITIEATDRDAFLKSGRSRFKLLTLPECDFPMIDVGDMSHSFDLPGEELRNILAKTTFSISTEEARYYLNGIFLHERGDRFRACSTDGHRLSLVKMAIPAGARGIPDIIVPLKVIKLLPKLIDKAETVGIDLSSSKIRFTVGSTLITSKLIQGTFPDYERVIPRGNDRLALMDRKDLRRAADRVSTVSTQPGRAIKFAFSDQGLTLSVKDPDAGDSIEEVDAEYSAPPLDIGFNARYVLDCLDTLDGENVEFLLAEPGYPTILRTPGQDEHTLVLTPMRAGW